MFRNRRNSQKPDEELYAAFKQDFPDVGPGTTSAGPGAAQRSTSLSDALTDPNIPPRHFTGLDDIKEHNDTPKLGHDQWRLTPSLMDPTSYAFPSFASLPPGYYTPTPGGMNTLYHRQAGDLHTPAMGMPLATPLSMAHGLSAQHQMVEMQHFQPHLLNPQQFQHPFAQLQQQSFAPSHFLQHQDSGYDAVADTPSPKQSSPHEHDMSMGPPLHGQSVGMPMEGSMAAPPMPMGEKFRFHVTLNAPTAMIRHAEEIPVTYLNKGQAYTMSVFDTTPLPPTGAPIKYRTFVRISFEDEQQRAKPGACWQLWKEGRGSNEAHQRGGKLLAVEYVDPNQGGDSETRRSQLELESASFDGFCVTWGPNPITGASDCSISVRFNFLSTDFSHSKGVKGIPVRLCAKTEMIMLPGSESPFAGESEVCFSKVKLFRDHGAERKLSNDVAHVKKTIEKLKQQISQAGAGIGTFGKRKRSGSMAKPTGSRPGKVLKHKRTWSIDSDGEGSSRLSAEEDLHVKLATVQDMFTSTRPVSVLYLRGDEQDDPDLFPVHISGEEDMKLLSRQQTWESRASALSSPTSSNVDPTTSSSESSSTPKKKWSAAPSPDPSAPRSRQGSDANTVLLQPVHLSPEQPVKVWKRGSTGSLLVVGVDPSYHAPGPTPIKPVACFYVRSKHATKEHYRAIYLMRRTVKDLVNGISNKFDVDPTRVTQVTHINSRGLHIVVDEDVVRELPEGQDMIVEFSPVPSDQPVKSGFVNTDTTDLLVDGEIGFTDTPISDPLEMWLNY